MLAHTAFLLLLQYAAEANELRAELERLRAKVASAEQGTLLTELQERYESLQQRYDESVSETRSLRVQVSQQGDPAKQQELASENARLEAELSASLAKVAELEGRMKGVVEGASAGVERIYAEARERVATELKSLETRYTLERERAELAQSDSVALLRRAEAAEAALAELGERVRGLEPWRSRYEEAKQQLDDWAPLVEEHRACMLGEGEQAKQVRAELEEARGQVREAKKEQQRKKDLVAGAKKLFLRMKPQVGVLYVQGPEDGVVVTEVKPGMPAEVSGLRPVGFFAVSGSGTNQIYA